MRQLFLQSFIWMFILSIGMASCSKENIDKKGIEKDVLEMKATFSLENSNYTVEIDQEIDQPEDYNYNTKGKLIYVISGVEKVIFDFGDGEKDTWASKTIDGVSSEVDLTQSYCSSNYEKIISSPLIKTDDCDFIVAGTIEFWKNGVWIATMDFGDGNCDDLVTKTWEGGSEEFSMLEWKKK